MPLESVSSSSSVRVPSEVLEVPPQPVPSFEPPPGNITGRRYGESGGGTASRLPSTSPLFLGAPHHDFAATFLAPNALFGAGHEAQFKNWAMKQVEHNPHIGAVYRAVIELLKIGERPTTVGGLLAHAQQAARASLENDPRLPADERERGHLVMLTALVALAAHALHSIHGEVTCLFPRYIPDGRPGEAGFDKCWHLIDQAMFAFVHLFDREYGDGSTARDFERAVEEADAHDAARHVAAAYDRTKGACGAYVPGTLPGPIGEETVYFAPPSWETDEERTAYALSVRIGDAHEYSPDFGDPSKIGSNFYCDPLAEIDATFGATSTLRDPGAARDLTANRTGAWFGVMAFRDPLHPPAVPLDDGANLSGQTFATGRAVPAKEYLALELSTIARVLGAESTYSDMLREVEQLGVKDATDRLRSDLTDLVDRLIATDRDRLARYYASFSVRFLQFGPIEGEEQRWRPHYDFAMGIPRERAIEHLLRRVDSVQARFAPPLHNPRS